MSAARTSTVWCANHPSSPATHVGCLTGKPICVADACVECKLITSDFVPMTDTMPAEPRRRGRR